MATTLRPIRHDDRLSLVEHLDELRKRLIFCVVVFSLSFGLCLWQSATILDIINRPLQGTAFKAKKGKDPFERTAAFQAQLRKSAVRSAQAFEALAAETEDTAAASRRDATAALGRPEEETTQPASDGVVSEKR